MIKEFVKQICCKRVGRSRVNRQYEKQPELRIMSTTPSEQPETRKTWRLLGRWYLAMLAGVLGLCFAAVIWFRPPDVRVGKALPGQFEADLKSLVAAMDYLLQPEPDYGSVVAVAPTGTLAQSATGQFSPGPTYSSNLVDLPAATNRAAKS
jgi:hypothetical protein